MTIEQFRERMATDEPIIGGSELHMEFHKFSQEALRITAEINGSYHTPEELRKLLSELWAIDRLRQEHACRRTGVHQHGL